jgi:hypothetical protein
LSKIKKELIIMEKSKSSKELIIIYIVMAILFFTFTLYIDANQKALNKEIANIYIIKKRVLIKIL